jgi:hypothetical protein
MKYDLVSKFLGYATKPDPTNIDARYLVSGSHDCLVNDSEKIETRKGYQIDGAEDESVAPVKSSFEWQTSSDQERVLRAANGLLQVRYEDSDGDVSWETLEEITSEALCFAPWWDSSRKFDLLLWVDGTDDSYEWSGAIATFSASTGSTVTIEGSTTIAALRFHTASTRGFRIKDNGGTWREFTYAGGESGQQFTTVSPDPTAFTFDVGAPIFQSVRTSSNNPASGFNSDFIAVIKNQVVFGSRTSRLLYISKNTDYTAFTFSSPRVAGEGEILTLDNAGRALAVLEESLYASAGTDDWYRISFEQLTVGTTLSETVRVKKLKTGAGQAVLHHDLVSTIGNAIVFISYDQQLRTLGYEENYPDVQMRSLSNPIKPDFDAEDFTGGHLKPHKNRIYITAPEASRVWINELAEDEQGQQRRFWQPPQTLPFRRIAIIEAELYGHSNAVPETYKAFTGYSDRLNADGEDGRPISVAAKFAYRNFGDRTPLKVFNFYRSEGYISGNTTLALTLNYDYGGATSQVVEAIFGTDTSVRFQPQSSNVLGDSPLGDLPLGSEEEQSDMPKFIIDHEEPSQPFFELQAVYESSGTDQRWQLLAHGPAVRLSPSQPTAIRQ